MTEWIKRRITLWGRATRREYAATMFAIALFVFAIKLFRLGDWLGYDLVTNVIAFAVVCFVFWIGIATQVRRLHDAGLSGYWAWVIFFIPFVGQIGMVLSLIVKADQFNGTVYYPDPRGGKST